MRKLSIFPGLYSIGAGRAVTLPDGNFLFSDAFNTRDVFTTQSSDYPIVGPGSQVWILGYSIRVSRPIPFPAPANQLGLKLSLFGSYDVVVPFIFNPEQQLILPVREGVRNYSGRARAESPAVQWGLFNDTGNDLEISYQFWGKAL